MAAKRKRSIEFHERKWKRRCIVILVAWLACTVLFSIREVRGLAIAPLHVHNPDATGEVAYVMAGGPAYQERIRAATDLYHMERVTKIAILEEKATSGYNFVLSRSETRAERAVDRLKNIGIPESQIILIPQAATATFGSLSEAQGAAKLCPEVKKWVVVSSSPHMRRSLLCFQRSLPEDATVTPYSASLPSESAEIHSPIWVEYAKLLVYWCVS